MIITKKRSDANNFELVIHYAEEDETNQNNIEDPVIQWMEYILKKYSTCVPKEV
ncbi:MAG: hypothetical protein ACQEXX_01045 [Bacillota bacterium]